VIQEDRVRPLNSKRTITGRYVLYWMQASQRTEYNHALEYAIREANELGQPLIAYFGLTDSYPEANARHYHFMLEGLRDVSSSLDDRGIRLVVRHTSPALGVVELSRDASLVVVDAGYLRIQKRWRSFAASRMHCPLIQVEADVVVPVELASPKEEYSAATFRPKMRRRLIDFLVPLQEQRPKVDSAGLDLDSFDITNMEQALASLNLDRGVGKVDAFRGGTAEAKRHLDLFLNSRLDEYPEMRNDPAADCLSHMSPYLHFGQISPLYIALRVMETGSPGAEAYLEELIVRRELSMNFVHYNVSYDSLSGLPTWAQKTLREHQEDPREHSYTLEELENARTHDSYWNAAQEEMRIKGKMHGYMRMYWGKKIIEWTDSPENAFRIALYLNNKYELDGRDPNGFTGVAWCFGKHDRPWQERHVFGKIRYMSADGLSRKFDARRYVRGIEQSRS
jgi:deoxyribodipyrimidine photo-lyase